jgi:tetratricopeptide (TPR) repeat protein
VSSTSFQKWDGPNEFTGDGGSYITKDGIDIYTLGEPNKKFSIIGTINHNMIADGTVIALFGDSWAYSNLAKEAKKQGGDAVILLNSKSKIVSFTGQGSISSSKTQAVVIKYMRQSDSSPASELMDKALAFWKNGKYTDPDKALEYLNKAISLDSNYALAYNNRGNAWADKGNHDRAIADFNRALEINPRCAEAYNNRGIAWANKSNHDRSIADYNSALEINPLYVMAYYNRGLAWAKKGNHDRAIADYNSALEINPLYVEAYNDRGIVWADKGNYDRAIADFNRALEINPR